MKKQKAFLVDSEKCLGCFTCAMACRNQYHQEPGIKWRDVHPLGKEAYPHEERAFLSLACNHCGKPQCLVNCPVGAISKRDDGIVVQDRSKCIGCEACVVYCRYQVPKMNPVTEKAEKCNMCVERQDAGRQTACILSCPVGALQLVELGTLDDPRAQQYPTGFPKHEIQDPSTRFIGAKPPHVVETKGNT